MDNQVPDGQCTDGRACQPEVYWLSKQRIFFLFCGGQNLNIKRLVCKGRTIRKVMGEGEGNFQVVRIFFLLTTCTRIFFVR